MSLLICAPDRDCSALAAGLRRRLPGVEVAIWPECADPAAVEFALVWRPAPGLFQRLPRLRAVCSLGAGVDALLADPALPPSVRVGRIAGPRLAADMAAYLVAAVTWHWKGLDRYAQPPASRRWRPVDPAPAPTVGLLGTGRLGLAAARAFGALDLDVVGWNRSGRAHAEVRTCTGRDGLFGVAAGSDVLINLLPLTPETRGLLDAALFQSMRPGSTLINVARGEHLVELDLLAALRRGRPARAVLDVFCTEPLPDDHPFWEHPQVLVTPHAAAITDPEEAAERAAESYRRLLAGHELLDEVDRRRGY